MGKYTGCECIICQKLFEDSDDIVVCPECGTPYHRICYQNTGHCINEPLHAVGGSWQSMQNEQRKKQGGIECSHCGYVNLPDAQTCVSCNLPLNFPEDPEEESQEEEDSLMGISPDGQPYYFRASDPCCGMSPEYNIEGERLGDVAGFVRTNTLYYIPLFRRFKETDRKLSLNLPCIIFPNLYFANRKMWLMSVLSSVIWLFCSLPQLCLNMISAISNKQYIEFMQAMGLTEDLEKNLNLVQFLSEHQDFLENLQMPLFCVDILFRAAVCLFGNYLYFRFVMKSVKKIRKMAPTVSVKNALLKAEGGTNFWNVIGCVGGLYFAVSIITNIIMELIS